MSTAQATRPSKATAAELAAELDRIDRHTVMLVACVPLLFAPAAILLALSGWGLNDPAYARLNLPTGLIIVAQGLVCMLLAALGRLKLAMACASALTLAAVLHSSLIVGMGLRTPTLTAMATLCFLMAYLYGSKVANAVAFVALSTSLVIALVVMINPAFLSDQQAPIVQPTSMLLSHLGLFINTQVICGAYSRKKHILLQHIDAQNADLEAALVKRREALRERQNLLGQIAHNLRTPLATINSALQLMERTAGQPERQQRYAANLRNATEKIQWQTEQFSVYEHLHDGQLFIRSEPVAVNAFIEQTVARYRELPQFRAVNLIMDTPGTLDHRLQIDPRHVGMMLRNLLDNALKYVQEGSITVRADTTESSQGSSLLTIAVEDDGPGLSADVIPDLFKPFIQGTENPANALEGSGLGLYITRGLARKMGGDAGAQNRPQGGCRAWFTLPADSATNTLGETARHAA